MNNKPKATIPSYPSYSHYDVINLISQKQYTEISQSLTNPTQSSLPPQTWGSLLIEHFISPSFKTFSNLISYYNNSSTAYAKTNIQILNQIFLHFHLANYTTVVTLFLSNIPVHSQHSYIFLTNSLLVLLDISITTSNLSLSSKLLAAFERASASSKSLTASVPDQSITSYLNNIEIFNRTWSKFNELIHIYKCYINLELSNIAQAKENLAELKRRMFRVSSLVEVNTSLVEVNTEGNLYKRVKHMYNMLKIKLDYLSGTQSKCIKHLKALIVKGGDCDYGMVYYYNVIGVLNLRNGKATVARWWFGKCLDIVKRNVTLMLRFGKMVMFNKGLAQSRFL